MSKLKLTNPNYKWIAEKIGWEPEMVISFNKVECKREPFDKDGFPAILYERHVFYRNLPRAKAQAFAQQYSDICYKTGYGRGGYGSYAIQRTKFSKAFLLDANAAMEACSWGAFQELGENWEQYGFKNVGEFVDTMKNGLYGQCDIFIRSIKARGLVSAGRNKQYRKLAQGYNGTKYAQFGYHIKLEEEYIAAKKLKINWASIKAEPPAAKEEPVWIGDMVESDALNKQLNIKDGIDEHELEDNFVEPEVKQEPVEEAKQMPVEEQKADIIINAGNENVNQNSASSEEEFKAEDKPVEPPAGENFKAKINNILIWLGLPPVGFGLIGTAKALFADGNFSLSDALALSVQVFYFVFPWVAGIAIAYVLYRMIKMVFKQISYIVRMILTANPKYHNITLPEQDEEQEAGIFKRWF